MTHHAQDAWKPDKRAMPPGLDSSEPRWYALTLPITLGLVSVLLLLIYGLPTPATGAATSAEKAFQSPLPMWESPIPLPSGVITQSEPGDLLSNGNMDQGGFYWRPPNHWIADDWFEWFSRKPYYFPEFNDGSERGFVHTRPSSQRLQLWGNRYAAGLMQSVSVTPCANYRFRAYGESRPGATNPPPIEVPSHMKVGVEPYGWMSGRSIPKYDPGLEPEEFPETVIWSDEKMCYFTFEPYSVTVEALSDTVTVILYSNPEVDPLGGVGWHDTVWDTASLIEVQPPSGTILDGASVPKPDGLIYNLQVLPLHQAVLVTWDTDVPASSQVLYRFVEPTPVITKPAWLTYSTFIPLLMQGPPVMELYTPLDSRPVRQHRIVISNLPPDYRIVLTALSRRLDDAACLTSASRTLQVTAPDAGSTVFVPTLIGDRED